MLSRRPGRASSGSDSYELERFGSTVEKFIGIALVGVPVAHEDDPERAMRAALAIRDWVAEESDLQVDIGVSTGERGRPRARGQPRATS